VSTWYVQVAVANLLNFDTQTPPIYDEVPEGAARPYGTFGPPDATREARFGTSATREIVLIDWWGNARETMSNGAVMVHGNQQISAFAARARFLLDGKPLPLESGIVTMLRWEQDVYLPDPDRAVRHVQQRFRIGVTS
jgi:hypothetical protein